MPSDALGNFAFTSETMRLTSSGIVPPFVSQRTSHLAPASCAARMQSSASDARSEVHSDESAESLEVSAPVEETPIPRRVASPEGPREVRHVAVVTTVQGRV